jgi:hypothetical protein
MRRRTGCNNQAGRNKFFSPPAPGDDPRAPHATSFPKLSPAKSASPPVVAGDNDGTAADDAPCPARSPDNSPEPAVATTAVPFPDTPYHSNTFARNKGESDAHNPPTGNRATADSTQAIEIAIRMDQTEEGSREVPLPRSQVSGRSRLLRPEAILSTQHPCRRDCLLLSTLIIRRQKAS